MEYPMCDRTVTVYRLTDGKVVRQILHGCYLQMTEGRLPGDERPVREFLLVIPGAEQRVFPGDRVVPGEGPVVTESGWATFLPVGVEQLLVVGKVRLLYWDGCLCHTEATN